MTLWVRRVAAIGAAMALCGLAACGKAQEKASEKLSEKLSEKAAEKMIESQIGQDGTKAKVDLSSGGARVTTTDAAGKTTEMEMGTAKVAEADVGVPFFPGATPVDGQGMKITAPDGVNASITLHSDAAAEKVAAYYREQLKTKAAGKQFIDMSEGDGKSMLAVSDDHASLQVHVAPADAGSEITIISTRSTKP